jgi:hypothetical protein
MVARTTFTSCQGTSLAEFLCRDQSAKFRTWPALMPTSGAALASGSAAFGQSLPSYIALAGSGAFKLLCWVARGLSGYVRFDGHTARKQTGRKPPIADVRGGYPGLNPKGNGSSRG